MTFKVKDLMIDISSATVAQIGCTHHTLCAGHTLVGCHLYCSQLAFSICHFGCTNHFPSICTHASVTVTFTCPGTLVTDTTPIFQTLPQLSGPALGNLKEQLKQALELAERQEVSQAEALKPQTVADAEMLEKKLGEAIEELRTRKAELQKKK